MATRGAEQNPAMVVLFQNAIAPMTSNDALRLAIKLAVDAGDFERATTLLEVARRMASRFAWGFGNVERRVRFSSAPLT